MKRPVEYHYIGKSMSNDNAEAKASGAICYTSDLHGKSMLHLACKPSTIAHGMIRRIDTSEAWKLPGVRGIYTCENTPDKYFDRGSVARYEMEGSPYQEKLFDRHIRFYGERVAAVAADTLETARKACRLIQVEYEELPAVFTEEEAMKPDAPQLHADGNVYEAPEQKRGAYEEVEAAHTFATKSHFGRMTHLSMETESVRARYDKGRKKMTIWCGTQASYGVRSTVADYLDMPYSKVHVKQMTMGGSFGCKQEFFSQVVAAYVAKDLCADVKWVFTREEQIVNTMLKHSLDATVESKVDEDGVFQGISVDLLIHSGAYQTISPSYTRTTGGKLAKIYRYPNITFHGRSVCTNTPVNGSFRSWGSSEAALMLETHMNYVARQLKMDPVELRLKNAHDPYETEIMHGACIEDMRVKDCMIQGRERFRWEERKAECRAFNEKQGRYRKGVGMAIISHTSSFYPYMADVATADLRVQDDGSLILHVPVHDHGCGTLMAMKKIAAEVFQMPLELIEANEADTEHCHYDYGCYGSRTTYCLGHAVKLCAEGLLAEAKKRASVLLGCLDSTVHYKERMFWSEPDPSKKVSLEDVWVYSLSVMGKDLANSYTHNSIANPGTGAAHFTQVCVDTYTGQVKVEHCLSVHDVGRAINPDLCIGQVGSGIQQGIGNALREEIKIDPRTGETLITNFKNYEVLNAADMPEYDVLLIENEEETGPFGAKGIGEVVVAHVAPAVVEAVNFALNTNMTRLPLTPAVILEAVEQGEGYEN